MLIIEEEKIKQFKAFTLAEILISVAVIGIIAVLVLPRVVNLVTEYSWARAQDTFEAKIEEATKQMNIAGLLSGYSTNSSFVDNFQNYVKIAQRCTNANLSDCFASNFTAANGEALKTSSLLTGADFGLNGNTSSLIGAQFIDGTTSIIAYNLSCTPPDWYNTSGSSYDQSVQSKRYSSGVTAACLSILYDVNGFKSPNKIDKDIKTWHVTLSTCEGLKFDGFCADKGDTPYNPLGQVNFFGSMMDNYWAGAKAACEANSKSLPTKAQLDAMFDNYKNGGNTVKMTTNNYWALEEVSGNTLQAYYKMFPSGTTIGYFKFYNNTARCVK